MYDEKGAMDFVVKTFWSSPRVTQAEPETGDDTMFYAVVSVTSYLSSPPSSQEVDLIYNAIDGHPHLGLATTRVG